MSRRRITKEELDRELESRIDPTSDLPPTFPAFHSRFPAVPSPAFLHSAEAEAPLDERPADDVASIRAAYRERIGRVLQRTTHTTR